MSKRLGGNIDCKEDKTSSWHVIGFPDCSGIAQQYNVGVKPTVILFTYCISRHAKTPAKTKTKDTMGLDAASWLFFLRKLLQYEAQ